MDEGRRTASIIVLIVVLVIIALAIIFLWTYYIGGYGYTYGATTYQNNSYGTLYGNTSYVQGNNYYSGQNQSGYNDQYGNYMGCNYNSGTREYVQTGSQCSVNFLCMRGSRPFKDGCGCGCELAAPNQPLMNNNQYYCYQQHGMMQVCVDQYYGYGPGMMMTPYSY